LLFLLNKLIRVVKKEETESIVQGQNTTREQTLHPQACVERKKKPYIKEN